MRNYWVFILAIVGCQAAMSPEEVFQSAKEKFYGADEVSFSHEMLWENPNLGEIDTIMKELIIQKHSNRYFDYNYIGKRKISEIAYVDEVLLLINHKDSTITYYSEEDDWDFVNIAGSNGFIDFSPVNLLKKEYWTFKQDTAIHQKKLLNFFRVDMDTTIDDKEIYLENHLFINPANLLVERYSRRLYHNGKRAQFIENRFMDYYFGSITEPLRSEAPQGYLSVLSGEKNREPAKLLAVGGVAPDFELQDLQGNSVRLSKLKGQKVLLDFSMINCGWCKIALEKFNKPDFQFTENLVPFYVNPVDSKEKMEKYSSRVDIPFSVLIDAKTVGEEYGVSGYPTFYLIDEDGKIEEVFEGFDDCLIDKIKKGS
jgi:peroxiredoxin